MLFIPLSLSFPLSLLLTLSLSLCFQHLCLYLSLLNETGYHISDINPNPYGWGRIWLPKLQTGITPQWLKLRKVFKLMYSSKNVSWVYLVKYFIAKNGVFGDLEAKTCAKPSVFCRFWLFRTAVKVYMTSPPPPQGRALPPPIVGAPSSSGTARTVSSSF
jgi:hypothetical protein